MPRPTLLLLALCLLTLLAGCASPSYTYRPVPGRTATLVQGYAVAPPDAPPAVQAAIAAGNEIVGLPYRNGGGHRQAIDSAYDCSGAVSYVLRGAGKMRGVMTSREFRRYGQEGEGEWINVYARRGHVFLSVAGLRFDTGWTDQPQGPQWTTADRPADGCTIRHPATL